MKGKRLRRLSGTVLIMVLTVMLVLIIMLMATLTVVTTASQRIYTKYEENQAYYSARSALDVFTQNMLGDSAYYVYNGGSTKKYEYGTGTQADMTQGLALQLDLYKIEAQSGQNISQSVLTSAHIPDKVQYNTYFGTEPGTTSITYQVDLPDVSDGSNSYGVFSEGNKAGIKVEILERDYDIGTYKDPSGTEVTVPDGDKDKFFKKEYPYNGVTNANIAEAFANGNRKNDKIKVKITATTTFMGAEGTAVLICDSSTPPENNSSRAVTTFGGSGSDNMNIIGGASMADNVNWKNDGVVYGSSYAEKNLTMNTGATVHLAEAESFLVGGNFVIGNSNFKLINDSITDKNKKPFLYVGGTLSLSNIDTNTFQDVDIIAHGIDTRKFDESGAHDGTSNKFFTGNGDVYCLGDLDLSAVQNGAVGGQVYVKGKLIISDSNGHAIYFQAGDAHNPDKIVNSFGSVFHVTGGVETPSGITATHAVAGSGIDTSSFNLDLPDISGTSGSIADPLGTTGKIDINLPGSVTKQVSTHVENFNDYYMKNSDGKLVESDGTTVITDAFTTKPVPISAESRAGVTGFSPGDLGIDTAAPTSGSIDTTGATGPMKYKISPDKGYNFKIKGGGTVELVVDGSSGTSFSASEITVDDDTTLNVYFNCPSGSTLTLEKWKICTKETSAALGGTTLNVGSATGNNIKVPKINYYAGDGTTIFLRNGGFLTGYIYAPGATINANVGPFKNLKMKYNGVDVKNTGGGDEVGITVVGSVLCNKIDFPNGNGIAYINPALSDKDNGGNPIHQWQSTLYTRN